MAQLSIYAHTLQSDRNAPNGSNGSNGPNGHARWGPKVDCKARPHACTDINADATHAAAAWSNDASEGDVVGLSLGGRRAGSRSRPLESSGASVSVSVRVGVREGLEGRAHTFHHPFTSLRFTTHGMHVRTTDNNSTIQDDSNCIRRHLVQA